MSKRAVGVNTWVWTSPLTDEGLVELIPHIAGLGFDVVEMPVEAPGAWDPARTAELLEANGLTAAIGCVMPPGRDLATDDTEVVTSTQEYLNHCIDVAATVGSPVVAGPAYSSVGRLVRFGSEEERSVNIDRIAGNLLPVAEYAGSRGVKIAIEPLNRYESSFINTVEQGLDLIERAGGHPALGLLLDSYHMNIEERNPAAAARAAVGRIAHVHTCGTDRGAPGFDCFDWPDFFAALDEVGYDGPVVIESFTADNEVIATATAIWRALAASPDALATDGLAFLRENA